MENSNITRSKQGENVGLFGICCNIVLVALKFATGLISGSFSIITDSVNNLFDAISSTVTFIGFKIASRPADKEHPYGHGRAEYIAGLTLAAIIMAVAVSLFRESVGAIVHHKETIISFTTVIILICTLPVKIIMGVVYKKVAVKIKSETVKAASTDSFCDVAVTSSVIISACLKLIFNLEIDAYIGALVAIFVFYQGLSAAKETISSIMGRSVEPEVTSSLESIAYSSVNVLGIHDLRIHEYGHEQVIASMHVELPNNLTLDEAHNIINSIEHEAIKSGVVHEITIHTDPVDIRNPLMLDIKNNLIKVLSDKAPDVSIHDLRIVNKEGTESVELDALMPYDYKLLDKEIIKIITDSVKATASSVSSVQIKIDRY